MKEVEGLLTGEPADSWTEGFPSLNLKINKMEIRCLLLSCSRQKHYFLFSSCMSELSIPLNAALCLSLTESALMQRNHIPSKDSYTDALSRKLYGPFPEIFQRAFHKNVLTLFLSCLLKKTSCKAYHFNQTKATECCQQKQACLKQLCKAST